LAGRGDGEVVFDRRKRPIVGRRFGNVKDRGGSESRLSAALIAGLYGG
jgi:hypothetical protein